MKEINQPHKDLFYTFINKTWRLVSGPIILLLIPLYLLPEQQGYWYLFVSLAALSVFADLGFANIILQFSAHEYAFLHFTEDGLLDGEEQNLKKLGSFFKFTIKWISTICVIVFPIIYVIGIVFFIRDHVLSIYLLPWSLYAIGSLVSFFNHSILSFIEGLNKIALIQKISFRVSIIYTVILVVILVLGGNIYALAFGLLLSSVSIFISIFGEFKKFLKQLLDLSNEFVYPWKKEVVPLFVRYALSWSSGYFIFQIYTPLMHYFHGAVYSGKVGITLSLVAAIYNMSNIWMYTIIPKMNIHISQKLWFELDKLFIKRLLLTIGTYLFIVVGVFVFMTLFGNFLIIDKIVSRFLPVISLAMLLGCYFIHMLFNSCALYLRGHKKEPYVIPSIVFAICVAISTFLAGKYLPPAWFFVGFLTTYICGIPVWYMIYRRCKRLWHGKSE